MRAVVRSLIACFLTISSASAEEGRPFTAEDLVRLYRVFDPQVSPDGDRVAMSVRETVMEVNRGQSDLWLYTNQRGRRADLRRLTTLGADDRAPRWSADGKTLYFLSNRTNTTQIWALPTEGGEARQVTDFPLSVTSLRVSPSGGHLVFSARVFPDCADFACTASRLNTREAQKETGVVYDRLMVRSWDVWRDGLQSHLFSLALDDDGFAAGVPVNLSAPLDGDVPAPPFGDSEAYAISADGRFVVFSLKVQGPDEAWSINSDLWRARIDGAGDPVNLTARNPARDERPVLSRNGRWLAWVASEGATRWAAARHVMLMDLRSGELRRLGADWDRSPTAIGFAANSRSILATADHLGKRALWRVPLNGKPPVLLVDDGSVLDFDASDKFIYFTKSTLTAPPELYVSDREEIGAVQLTPFNKSLLEGVELGEFEQFSFKGADDDTVYGYVVRPVGLEAGQRYPVAFIIHGGPHSSKGNSFHFRWNPQTYAGAGYGVVFIDFHGSTGYGQAFVESIIGDRGGRTLTDLKLGLAAALDRYPWLDGERVCALGASFGGYMVNWIAGAWPDRFKCLVNHDGIFDNRMKYYTSDINGYLEEAFGGPPFAPGADHETHNPARLVDNWQTPMLVIHGGQDFRVTDTQGLAAFTAAQRKGIPSRFLYFPDENHWILKPHNSLQWHREVEAWLARWLKDTSVSGE
ncbi:MAG: S9 family peptidase [Sphingomonadales bacterium]|nr:S9 family peptidase [Sphingomonadales bacterium]